MFEYFYNFCYNCFIYFQSVQSLGEHDGRSIGEEHGNQRGQDFIFTEQVGTI